MYYTRASGFVIFLIFFIGCKSNKRAELLFALKDNDELGIQFINQLDYTEELNTYTFRNFYNGGGVAVGDINNDGLLDVFLSGNLVDNVIYLNKGNWKFEDISESAGIKASGAWSMGAAIADINGDGFLDIYVCKSGPPGGPNRNNALYINNGDLSFTDHSKEYGVADEGLSTHAAFFDFDKDGDLDFYLLNNSIRSVGGYDFRPGQRDIRDTLGGNKFYRNEGDYFTDVSAEVGIYTSAIGFGLGVTVGDVNGDGWQDMYVSNDYFEKDYLYINNQKGGFEESLEDYIREISLSSMGADMGDLNNDGFPEIFVTDMLPSTEKRIKTKTTFDNWDKYQIQLQNGYYRQFTRNTLQLNNGDGTFAEISRMAGTAATDWSWGALIFDMDNDGYKDIFVANGIYKDLTDQDYVNFIGDPRTVREILKRENQVITRLIDSIPSEPIPNCAFHNLGQMQFSDKAVEWGMDQPSFSNGSAYGDLDNDGDLDLIISNVNMPPFVYENRAKQIYPERNFLTIDLKGAGLNTSAIGTKVYVYSEDNRYFQEHMPMRSYQSTTDHRIHFGLGDNEKIDSIIIEWPDSYLSKLYAIHTDTVLTLDYEELKNDFELKKTTYKESNPVFTIIDIEGKLNYTHRENDFVDFDRERLIPHMVSNDGPCLCKGDVDGDSKQDIYLGGAKNQPGALFIQKNKMQFSTTNNNIFLKDQLSEDTDCEFIDADADGDLDLYVASGGNEFPSSSAALLDRLYINNGKGIFEKSEAMFPVARYISSSTVRANDFDKDGDQDLFVGGRLNPFAYGTPADGFLLENDGTGNFTDIKSSKATALNKIGMIKDASWADIDGDGDSDLVIVGEWMNITILINEGDGFTDFTKKAGLQNSAGLYNCITPTDIDNDGDIDFVVGNLGLNSRIKASVDKPVTMHINDFDKNGTIEQIISAFNGEDDYPMILRQDLIEQLPGLKTRYLKFKNYSEQQIEDIFTEEQLNSSILHTVYNLETVLLVNDGTGVFTMVSLPVEAQRAPVYAISTMDYNSDGLQDLLIGGNFYKSKPEIGIYDASYGLLLKGNGDGSFIPLKSNESGILIKGEIREIEQVNTSERDYIIIARNNDTAIILEKHKDWIQ